jgi:hypothetical protein
MLNSYRRAFELKPDYAEAHFNYAQASLLLENYAEGWRHYRYRHYIQGQPALFPQQPLPEDLSGKKLLLRFDQGLGDELFFLRFAPQLKERGARLAYCSSRKLYPLLQGLSFLDELFIDIPTDGFDMTLSIGDLPYLVGMNDRNDIPASLELTPSRTMTERVQQYLASLGMPPYIGLSWRGGTIGRSKLFKEIPLAELARAVRGVNATFVSLQRIPGAEETAELANLLGAPVHDASAMNDDLPAMLALLALLDNYVGVSNTNMHFTACLGKTARVLIPSPPEWRWQTEGEESAWYPKFKVYRQYPTGDWSACMRRLASDLSENI